MIENFSELATSDARKKALFIAEAVLASVDTKNVVTTNIHYNQAQDILVIKGNKFELARYDRVICVGFGKAAFNAVSEIQKILGGRIKCGFVLDLKGGEIDGITCSIGTHPTPSIVNVQATQQLVSMLADCSEKDLVLCVVSGGGSALLCYPHSMTCETQSEIITYLNKSGATIHELNIVRKHISRVKGGNLAKVCYPAAVVGLIFSDVPGNDVGLVASGPTVLDNTTIHEAREILDKYNVVKGLGLNSIELFETPKESMYFENVKNILLVSGEDALTAGKKAAEEVGFKVRIKEHGFEGEARELGPKYARDVAAGWCEIGAGESTVKVAGQGLGGRNQEMVLASLSFLKAGQVFVSLATDGQDNTDAAGAIADTNTLERAQRLHLDPQYYLDHNDSYHFFEQTGDLLFTGLTGSNVSDVYITLRE